ncbi:alginate export family protein [Roseibacillus ishigakijimensis]|nr:alginate export family protein [Roseibacillus ishigakijimensis]
MKFSSFSLPSPVLVPALSALLLPAAWAGEPEAVAPPAARTEAPDAFQWLTPSVDFQTRYEFRDQSGLDASNALTARARVGLLLGDFGGFSAFAEGEFTGALANDYRSNPTGSDTTYPYVEGNTVIGDPQNAELNQAWVQYEDENYLLKVGRQRLIRNKAAFIGNVGWRQNEQTFDAIQAGYERDGFALQYVFSNRVQRIFGHDANDAPPGPPLHDFEGEFHFVDGSYQADFGTVGGYAYLIDVDNNANVGLSNTYGLFTDWQGLHAEVAFQEGDSAIGGDYEAFYGHLSYTHKVGSASLSAGWEYLEDDFKTPFATVHAYNGFADAFVLDRIGLRNGPGGDYEGLSDFYLGYVQPGLPGGVTFKGFLHYYANDGLDSSYGYEADAVFVKQFTDSLSAMATASYFLADESGNYPDIRQVTVSVGYRY